MDFSYKYLLNLLGQPKSSAAYQQFTEAVRQEPSIITPISTFEMFGFYQYGINLTFDHSMNCFRSADLYIISFNEYSSYPGSLPFDIFSTDAKGDVIAKAGKLLDSGKTRRRIEGADPADEGKWKDFLKRQTAQPFTISWFLFDQKDWVFRASFDDDHDGRLASAALYLQI